MRIFNGELANHLPHQLLRSQRNNGVAALREFWEIQYGIYQLTMRVNDKILHVVFRRCHTLHGHQEAPQLKKRCGSTAFNLGLWNTNVSVSL